MTEVKRGAYLRGQVRDGLAGIAIAGNVGDPIPGYSDGFNSALSVLAMALGLCEQPRAARWQPVRHAYLLDDLANTVCGVAAATYASGADPAYTLRF